MNEKIHLGAALGANAQLRSALRDALSPLRAHAIVRSCRPKNWVKDPKTGLLVPDVRMVFDPTWGCEVPDPDMVDLLLEDEADNVTTDAGMIFLHTQGYSTASGVAAGLCYIALSNDAVTETASSTTLSNEIAANGLSRAVGTVTLPTTTGRITTVAKTFTASGNQSAQKAALFTASSSGTMNHVLAFTQRALISGDTLAVTFSITLS